MNVDHDEVAKFEALAHRWWDPEGDFRPLHDINPLRENYIKDKAAIANKKVLDIGCGGGILTESMARSGADVTGIDAGEAPITIAKLHALESELEIDYRVSTIEAFVGEEFAEHGEGQLFDVITCLEMLEHVPDIHSVISHAASLLKPGGDLFLSTINRNAKAYVMAIFGAEYILNLLPKGTHDYKKLIRPSELAGAVRRAGLTVLDLSGMSYNPFSRHCKLTDDVDVNYLLHAKKAVQ